MAVADEAGACPHRVSLVFGAWRLLLCSLPRRVWGAVGSNTLAFRLRWNYAQGFKLYLECFLMIANGEAFPKT